MEQIVNEYNKCFVVDSEVHVAPGCALSRRTLNAQRIIKKEPTVIAEAFFYPINIS